MHWEQKFMFYFIAILSLHVTNFSLGFEPFLLRRFLMWSFDFAVEFLLCWRACFSPGVNQPWKSEIDAVGEESVSAKKETFWA